MTVTCACRRVGVLGRLSVTPEERLPASARRAIAYLAVRGPVVQRSLMSMELWPLLPDTRARANLRRALWQMPSGWVQSSSWEVRLDGDIEVDLIEARLVAQRALAAQALDASEVDLLTRDLLPGWYEEWLLGEQDSYHLMRIQCLEAVCRTASALRQFGLATRAGLAAVSAEPLRHSAVLALIDALVKEGNAYEAHRRYESYRDLLHRELGVEPGPEITSLVVTGARRARTASTAGTTLRKASEVDVASPASTGTAPGRTPGTISPTRAPAPGPGRPRPSSAVR